MDNIEFGNRQIKLPRSKAWRVVLGVALIVGGILGFLPVVGFWMIPLGIMVLSIDFHPVRRFRRRMLVKWGRRKQRREGLKSGREMLEDEYFD